jgi:dolichyl-diphosphooligosaccharide--protein glycosyltransferase
MAPWPLGHVIEYAGRRPTVTDNFGDDIGEENFHRARRYYLGREGPGSQVLEQLGVRYVVAQSKHAYLGETPAADAMFYSLYSRDGSESGSQEEDQIGPRVEALERHRLIYESRPRRGAKSDGPPLYKIFEFVKGARISGRAAPAARIRLTLPLRSNRGRALVYAASAVADAQGRYALRVPYSNRGALPAFRAAPNYTLECEGESASLQIDEAAIRSGREVRGPDLPRARRRRSRQQRFLERPGGALLAPGVLGESLVPFGRGVNNPVLGLQRRSVVEPQRGIWCPSAEVRRLSACC